MCKQFPGQVLLSVLCVQDSHLHLVLAFPWHLDTRGHLSLLAGQVIQEIQLHPDKNILNTSNYRVFKQEFKEIRQWPINLCTSPIIIHKITFLDYQSWLKHLYTKLNKPTNQNSIKVPKVLNPTNKKTLL